MIIFLTMMIAGNIQHVFLFPESMHYYYLNHSEWAHLGLLTGVELKRPEMSHMYRTMI